MLCFHCVSTLSFTQQEEKNNNNNKKPLLASLQQLILYTLIIICSLRCGVGRQKEGAGCHKQLTEMVPGFTSLFPARAVHCLLIRKGSRVLGRHWASVVWMWFRVELQQEPAWHSRLSQRLLCKQRSLPPFMIYKQYSWVLQQDQEYTIIKHPLGCLACRQRRMSWYCFTSPRRSYPNEKRDVAAFRRRHKQKEGGRQSAIEERQV